MGGTVKRHFLLGGGGGEATAGQLVYVRVPVTKTKENKRSGGGGV